MSCWKAKIMLVLFLTQKIVTNLCFVWTITKWTGSYLQFFVVTKVLFSVTTQATTASIASAMVKSGIGMCKFCLLTHGKSFRTN